MKTVAFRLPDGPLLARDEGDLFPAQGIPYTRAERFGRPEPVPAWREPLEALRPGPQSLQEPPKNLNFLGELPIPPEESENCQTLEVIGPKPDGRQHPVMVWIHGGSYILGYGGTMIYDSSKLVREGDVIVVHINYRLGLLGFQRMEGVSPANLGLMDMLCALQWVKRNISAFGGDPEQVTVFGQSAGADGVSRLLLADGAEELFSRAILQSMPIGLTSERQEMMDLIRGEAERRIGSRAKALSLLRDEILKLQEDIMMKGVPYDLKALMPYIVEAGQPPLPAEEEWPKVIQQRAKSRDLLFHYTRDEMLPFLWLMPEYKEQVKYPLLREALTQGATYDSIAKDSIRLMDHHVKSGGRAMLYRFDWHAPESRYGAAHGIELPFLFENEKIWGNSPLLKGSAPEERAALGKALRKRWTDFAHHGITEEQAPEIQVEG